jgi:hypothetical protein
LWWKVTVFRWRVGLSPDSEGGLHGCRWNLLNDAFLLGRRVYWGEVRCSANNHLFFSLFSSLFIGFHTSLSPYQKRRAFKARLVKTQITITLTHLREINIHKNTFVQVTRLTIHDSIALVIRQLTNFVQVS